MMKSMCNVVFISSIYSVIRDRESDEKVEVVMLGMKDKDGV